MDQPPGRDRGNDGFSDSDQAWFERLTARAPHTALSPSASEAEREAELLRQALAQAREAAARDAPAAAEARWQRTRARLQREGLLEHPRPARRLWGQWPFVRAGWAGALAAGLVGVVVLVQRPGDGPVVYDEPPALRSPSVEQLRVPVEAPRTEAEALVAVLREGGWKAAIYQRGREFIVDTTVDAELPAPARQALAARGVRSTAGSVRLVFAPR